MPMVCEVCGVEEEAEGATLQAHLHLCADCRKDRQQPEWFVPTHEDN
ncbi:hypothetical protein P9314_12590 [Paenibacillus validus]|uniref:Inhibitor of sigma-G Gin n=1 Tax=Paenibacillus validus TaxID=44253 RepID=A0A7X3CSX7_9BACL|nr:hypothetical protein [Paenibacillus validus]MED4601541.1 hypothetical protein [Paenibacillus validus]MED4604702.1 hypothetical protein [Paenibacillus validus]MUG72250.1 hypothetical protein [Paenibacillus validus]